MRKATLVTLGCAGAFALSGCGTQHTTQTASPVQRQAIDRVISKRFSPKPPLRLMILSIAIARSDAHFASAVIQITKADRKPQTDRALIVLMEIGGRWQLVDGPGTFFPEDCTAPTARAVRDLVCPRAGP